MNNILMLLIVLMMTSCALPDPIDYSVPPDVQDIVNEFKYVCNVQVNVPIGFADLQWGRDGNKTAGICRKYSNGRREIIIDKFYWDLVSIEKREGLVFHELGHCVLDRDHDNSQTDDGCPTTLMNSEIVSAKCLNKYREYYYAELCN